PGEELLEGAPADAAEAVDADPDFRFFAHQDLLSSGAMMAGGERRCQPLPGAIAWRRCTCYPKLLKELENTPMSPPRRIPPSGAPARRSPPAPPIRWPSTPPALQPKAAQDHPGGAQPRPMPPSQGRQPPAPPPLVWPGPPPRARPVPTLPAHAP